MPRATWNGFLRLALVSCPIYLSPATARTKSIRLHQVWQPAAATEGEAGEWVRDRDTQRAGASRPQRAQPQPTARTDQGGTATRIALRPHDPRTGAEIERMLDRLAPGDVVMVTRIDRLARSTLDLFGIVKRIVDAKAQFRSLAEPWADTGTRTGRLMLAVLGGLADVERDLIRTRTAEGRSRAKAQGKHMGRPPSLTPAQQKEAIRRRAQGATLQELAHSYNRSISTKGRATRAA